jgi:hypothetical protein
MLLMQAEIALSDQISKDWYCLNLFSEILEKIVSKQILLCDLGFMRSAYERIRSIAQSQL